MPKVRTQIIPEQVYPAGTRSGTFTVPRDVMWVQWSATRVNWSDTGEDILKLNIDLSLDSGQTWRPWVGFTARGGDVILRNGSIATESSCSTNIPEPTSNRRRLRVEVINTIELTTGIAVTVE